MKRFAADPRSASVAGTTIALIAAIAIFVFHAPAWVLVPIMIAGLTAYAELNSWANRRLGRWR
jgi:hypothetical protein